MSCHRFGTLLHHLLCPMEHHEKKEMFPFSIDQWKTEVEFPPPVICGLVHLLEKSGVCHDTALQ